MSSSGVIFIVLCVALPIAITEMLLLMCWRAFGGRGAYLWYSCLLRTLAYSPCIVVGGQALTPLPVSAALCLQLFGRGGEIVWLYGLPEIFVGLVCCLISFGVRLISSTAK